MSVVNEVFDSVRALARAVPGVYADISVGALPAGNGISMTVATGAPETVFLDRASEQRISVVLNGKHADQRTVSDVLGDIHAALTRRAAYPSGNLWQITAVETVSLPGYIGREDDGQWLYGSSLRIKFYFKKG